jgi:hypothetical protein
MDSNNEIKRQIGYLNFELQIYSLANEGFSGIKTEKELKLQQKRNQKIKKFQDEITAFKLKLNAIK